MRRRIPTALVALSGAALLGSAALPAGATASQPAAAGAVTAAAAPTFTAPTRADDPAIEAKHGQKYVNEPATVVAADGTRYVAYQRDSQLSSTKDGGKTWQYLGGEDVLTKNQSGCSNV